MTTSTSTEIAEKFQRQESLPALERAVRYEIHAAVADELLVILAHLIEVNASSGAIAYVEGRLDGHQHAARTATEELDPMPPDAIERISKAVRVANEKTAAELQLDDGRH